jgi:hypothetical protein
MRAILIGLLVFMAMLLPAQGAPDVKVTIKMVNEPTQPLTTQWCFVVDNSRSMKDVFYKARGAFLHAVELPGDQLEYAIVSFNNQGVDRFREWEWASADSFEAADRWIRENPRRGVMSYGATAISTALRQPKDKLTVVLITDGGFTEVSRAGGDWGVIRRVFEEGQQWRANNNLPPALVTCLGISNPAYRAGNKPPDEQCQAFLSEIGQRFGGGYWLVTGAIE